MRFRVALLLLAACSSKREPVPSAGRPRLAAVQAQLATVLRPEPAGLLAVRIDPARVEVARVGQPGVELTIVSEPVAEGVEVHRLSSSGRYEELRLVTRPAARVELAYRITLGRALVSLRQTADRVEALDANGVARLRTEPAFAVDARGTIRALSVAVSGTDVTWSLDARDLAVPIAIDPAWTTTGSLSEGRAAAAIFSIPGNKLLIVGGSTISNSSTSEIYDVATGSFTLGPSLTRVRVAVRPIELADGRIMVAGGAGVDEVPPTADVYDPATGKFTKTSAMPVPFYRNNAVGLADGGALVTNPNKTAVWNGKTDVWTLTTAPAAPRKSTSLVLLPSGKVMMIGGSTTTSVLSSVEQYDPKTASWTALASLLVPRTANTVTLTAGKVVVIGGLDGTASGAALDSVEVYDVAGNTWSAGPKLTIDRQGHAAAALPDGRILVAGGLSTATLLRSTEIVDIVAKTSVPAGSLLHARASFPMAPVVASGARMIAVGGYNGGTEPTAEIWSPLAIGAACTAAGECENGFCVDGVCCEKLTCPSGQTCGGSGDPGHCRLVQGASCDAGSACASGFCVDGVCCDRACGGVCEACDLATSRGSCATLPPGDSPHGALRPRCPGTAPCTALCGGVESTSCTIFPGAATKCSTASCAAGVESPQSGCDGSGACTKAKTTRCEPFACGELACKRACAVDADCAPGYSCDAQGGRCVYGAKCDGDHTVIIPGSASLDCTPYKCGGASCLARCASTTDCVTGTTCDTAAGKCQVVTAADAGSGCRFGRSRAGAWVLALAVAALRARRR